MDSVDVSFVRLEAPSSYYKAVSVGAVFHLRDQMGPVYFKRYVVFQPEE